MIVKFNYGESDRLLAVLKLDKSTIEGFDLNKIQLEEEPGSIEYKTLVEEFSKTDFDSLNFEMTKDPEKPDCINLAFKAPADEKYNKYMKFYRKFSMAKTDLNFKLTLTCDEAALRKSLEKVNELNDQLKTDEVVLEHEVDKEKGVFKLEYIKSKNTEEIVLRVESQEGLRYFYAPEPIKDLTNFKQFLETMPNLLEYVYNLGKENIPLDLSIARILG